MKLSEVPEQFKWYIFKLSNKEEYIVNSKTKNNILKATSNLIEIGNDKGFNKAFIVSWDIHKEKTIEEVLKNKDKLKLNNVL